MLAASSGAAWAQFVPLTIPAGQTESFPTTVSGQFTTGSIAGTFNIDAPGPVGVGNATFSQMLTVSASGAININSAAVGLMSSLGADNAGTFTNNKILYFLNQNGDGSIPVLVNSGALINNAGASMYMTLAEYNPGVVTNTGTITNAGLWVTYFNLYSTEYVPVNNSGVVTLLPGSNTKVGPNTNESFNNVKVDAASACTLLVQTVDTASSGMRGMYVNNADCLVQLDPASGGVQTFVSSTGDVVGKGAQIIGAGEVRKTSAGTTIFAYPLTYTGPTNVNAGTLLVKNMSSGVGSNVASALTTVASGATLGGDSTVGKTKVLAGGTLKPGTGATSADTDAIATLKVQGDLALDASSNAIFKLAAPDAPAPVAGVAAPNGDVVAVTGGLTLNGTIKVTPQTGFAIGAYKVITYTGSLTKTAQLLKAATVDNSTVTPLGFVLSVDDATVPGEVWLVVKAAPVIQPQTITYTSTPPAAAEPGSTYNAAATATSGLPVVLTSTTPAICTISNGVVTFLAEGICTLAADQAGNADFTAAPQVLQTMAVSGGRIITGPGTGTATPVPALHPAALALLGLLAAAFGGAALRRRRNLG